MELNALNLEKNEMIGIIAHDLKNPLTSALSISELFSSEKITEDQKEYLSLIRLIYEPLKTMPGQIGVGNTTPWSGTFFTAIRSGQLTDLIPVQGIITCT